MLSGRATYLKWYCIPTYLLTEKWEPVVYICAATYAVDRAASSNRNSMPRLPCEALGREVKPFQLIRKDINLGWQVFKHIDSCIAIKISILPTSPSLHLYSEPFISSPLPLSRHLSPPKGSAWPQSKWSGPEQKQWLHFLTEVSSLIQLIGWTLILILHTRGKAPGQPSFKSNAWLSQLDVIKLLS